MQLSYKIMQFETDCMDAIICSYCGTRLPSNINTCTKCGLRPGIPLDTYERIVKYVKFCLYVLKTKLTCKE